MVAVQGRIDTIFLQSNQKCYLGFDWIEDNKGYNSITILKGFTMPNMTFNWKVYTSHWGSFVPEDIQGYNTHSYTIQTKTEIYRFIKYTDKSYLSTTVFHKFLSYLEMTRLYGAAYANQLHLYPSCSSFLFTPKLFSWEGAQTICRKANGTLPEFVSRSEQEEFIYIVKSSADLFPVEAVFIGLHSNNYKKVGQKMFFDFVN